MDAERVCALARASDEVTEVTTIQIGPRLVDDDLHEIGLVTEAGMLDKGTSLG